MPCSLPNLMSLIDGIIILILKHQLFLGSILTFERRSRFCFLFFVYLKKPLNPLACSYTKTDNTIRFYIELLT